MNPSSRDLQDKIRAIEQIPTLPVVSQKLMTIRDDDPDSHRKFVEIIEADQALSLKLLKLANSSFYNSLSRVSSVDNAVVRLGMKEVRNTVLAFSVQGFFSRNGDGSFDRNRFWKHAVVCSQVARFLGNHYRVRKDDSLFLSGLIHDMGKVVIDEYFHDDFLRILDTLGRNRTTFSRAEKAVMGSTHYQIAAKLLKQWRFPTKVVFQTLYHHAPWYDKSYETNTILIYLANLLAKFSGYRCHPDEMTPDPEQFAVSPEADYVVKSGFELDLKTIRNMISHIQELIQEEADSVLTLFADQG
ncbi:MAG: HDOD domain-containing protein [Deltaproteobacteria bacterium]|nr:HDOD domain-containing protein [Deltaproteobacteria bacterium]